MAVDFVPSIPVVFSLFACGVLPVVLIALSHGIVRIARPGQRFIVATALTWMIWSAAMFAAMPNLIELLTGVLLLATGTLIAFTLWTLIAWGFTLSMLLTLSQANRPLSAEEWALAYTRGQALEAFTRDRLGILIKLGLASIQGNDVVMTPRRGRLFARVVVSLRKLFGVRP